MRVAHGGVGPPAVTRATRPPGSLSEQMAKDWSKVESYALESGALRLNLSGDVYLFEPIPHGNEPSGE